MLDDDVYATADHVFVKHDISELVGASSPVVNGYTWCKRLPASLNGVTISTKYMLLDTKRSETNYVNTIGEVDSTFCLDKRPNTMNTFLQQQAILPTHEKSAIRLAEYQDRGSTTILDCGDTHVVKLDDKAVVLRRLKKQSDIPSGQYFKHASEKAAQQVLQTYFPSTEYYVDYEPFVLNFCTSSRVVGGVTVHCYNVDFRIRMKISATNIGVEVKTNMAAWRWKEAESRFKMQKYELLMGAPCLVLIIQPTPRFYKVLDADIEPFLTYADAVRFVKEVSKLLS